MGELLQLEDNEDTRLSTSDGEPILYMYSNKPYFIQYTLSENGQKFYRSGHWFPLKMVQMYVSFRYLINMYSLGAKVYL